MGTRYRHFKGTRLACVLLAQGAVKTEIIPQMRVGTSVAN